ncbi:MAG: single-stranded DNA-binding protein [Comamonadaceae bacterium]|nr:single-stranded DNA-binding protein [Comamonadaceae bacterium]
MAINKAILVGNLGKDPELRYTASGQAVATFSLATTEKFKNKGGEQQERTEWHNIVAWGPLGRDLRQVPGQGEAGLRRRAHPEPLL